MQNLINSSSELYSVISYCDLTTFNPLLLLWRISNWITQKTKWKIKRDYKFNNNVNSYTNLLKVFNDMLWLLIRFEILFMCGDLYLCKEDILYRMYFLSKGKSDSVSLKIMKTWKLFGFTLNFQSYYDGIVSAEVHIMGDRCHREG